MAEERALARKLSGGFFSIFKRGLTSFQRFSRGLIAISASITMLAASIYMLKDVPIDKLKEITKCLAILIGLVGGLSILSTIITGFAAKWGSSHGFTAFSVNMFTFALGIVTLIGALKLLETIKIDNLGWKITGLIVIMAALMGVGIAMSKWAPQLTAGGIFLVAFAASVFLLVKALQGLSDVKFDILKDNWTELSAIRFCFTC